jgi:hypothetical protein
MKWEFPFAMQKKHPKYYYCACKTEGQGSPQSTDAQRYVDNLPE